MELHELTDCLERNPIISAVTDDAFAAALASPTAVVFCLDANLLTVGERIAAAHAAGKRLFIHMDLAEGLGRDKAALAYLRDLGADGIISTRVGLIKLARECGLLTVQRFFTLDTKGLLSVQDMLAAARPDMMEIMPGIVPKIIRRFADGATPVIAGGLIETKAEVTEALSCGAFAVSTGKAELWRL